MRKLLCFAFVFLSAFAFGQTATVSGHTITGQNTTSSSGISILFELTNDGGQQCKVSGTGLVMPMTATFTQAQLAAGISLLRNDQITCGTTLGATRWRYTIKANGVGTRQCAVNIATATLNLDSTACLNATSTPVTVTPTDSVYCRLDGTNCGFTGAITFTSLNKTIYADQQSGIDACAKIVTAIGLLPSTGGIVDATGFQGNQVCASGITFPASKPITLKLGAAALSTGANVAFTIPASGLVCIKGMGPTVGGASGTTSVVSSTAATAIEWDGSDGCLEDVEILNGTGNGLTLTGSGTNSVAHNNFKHLHLAGLVINSGKIGLRLVANSATALVTENTFTGIVIDDFDISESLETTGTQGPTDNYHFGFTYSGFAGAGTAGIRCTSGDVNTWVAGFISTRTTGVRLTGCSYNMFLGNRFETGATDVNDGGTGTMFTGNSFSNCSTSTFAAGALLLGSNGNTTCNADLMPRALQVAGLSSTKGVRDCRQDGVVADGTTNDRVALNNCIANAYTNGQAVRLPSGKIKVSGGAINDTNKPGMVISGVGSNLDFSTATTGQDYGTGVTQIMCDTGAVCWDATGSGEQKLNNFGLRIANTYSTPSTFGFLFGRDNATSNGSSTGAGTYCFSENIVLNNVWVFADSLPAATAVGRVGIYNMGAEAFTIHQGGIVADLPLMFGTSNVLSLASPFQTLSTGCPASMTEVHLFAARLQAITKQAVRFDDQIIDFESDAATEILNNVIGTNHNAAFFFNAAGAGQHNVFLHGQVEGFDFPLVFGGNADRINAHLMLAAATAGMVQFSQNNLTLSSSELDFRLENGSAQPLINAAGGTGETITGSVIREGGLSGSGATASNVTLKESTVYAPGLTDANVNTFASGSQYALFDDSGTSVVGILRTPGNVARVTSDFTSANSAALQVITGLSFSIPAVAVNYAFHCAVRFSQATNVAGDQFGVASLTTAPTLLSVDDAKVATNATTITNGNLDGFSTTTPTAFVTFTPAVTTQLGATFDGVLEASGLGASTLQFYVLNGTAADVIVVKKDSFCTLHPQ